MNPLLLVVLFVCSTALLLDVEVLYPIDGKEALFLRGEGIPGLNWSSGLECIKSRKDVYVAQVYYSKEDIGSIVAMKPLIGDSIWSIGSNFEIKLTSDATKITLTPHFYNTTGSWKYFQNFYSPQLKHNRRMVIYYPPSYYENPYKRYDVLFMHDGQNLLVPECPGGGCCPFGCWKIHEVMEPMIVEGYMEEVAVVGIYTDIDREDELTYSYDPSEKMGGKGDLYLDFLEETVLVWSEKRIRLLEDYRDRLSMIGSSLGGIMSCYAGLTRPETWKKSSLLPNTNPKVGCMSSSFWWNDKDFHNVIVPAHKDTKIWFYLDSGDQGDQEDDKENTIQIREDFISEGYNTTADALVWYYLDKGGEHNEFYWNRRFYLPMSYFFRPRCQ